MLEAHLTALRDLEHQLAQNTVGACQGAAMPAAVDPGAVSNRPKIFDQHASLIAAAAAFACDLSRVASFQFSNGHDNAPYPWLGYQGAHHDNPSHDEGSQGRALRPPAGVDRPVHGSADITRFGDLDAGSGGLPGLLS